MRFTSSPPPPGQGQGQGQGPSNAYYSQHHASHGAQGGPYGQAQYQSFGAGGPVGPGGGGATARGVGGATSQQQGGSIPQQPGIDFAQWGMNPVTAQMGMQIGQSAVAAGQDYVQKNVRP